MGGIYRRKGNCAKNKLNHRILKTKSYKRANDQIHDDIVNQINILLFFFKLYIFKIYNTQNILIQQLKNSKKNNLKYYIKPENIQKWQNQPIDETLPGLGQYYCVSCARYFVNEESIKKHQISKQHKKQEKRAKEKPYTHMEAELAGK